MSTQEITEIENDELKKKPEDANFEKFREGVSLFRRLLLTGSYAYVKLDCKNKEIFGLSGSLSSYKYLQFVDLSENELENLEGISVQQFLVKANFSKNKVVSLQPFQNGNPLKFLQSLDLSKNLIEEAVFNFCPSLKNLNLSSNSLKYLNLAGLSKLEVLEVRQNKLDEIAYINQCEKLKNVYAAENQFQSLKAFAELPALEILHLRQNPLTSSEGFFPQLAALNLRNSGLAEWPELNENFPNLKIINLLDTPLAATDDFTAQFIKKYILDDELIASLLISGVF